MIHFHGGPITPDTCALKAWKGRHAFISFANAGQLALASEVTQSFALDNGAFSFWTKKRVVDWNEYYRFVERWANHPRFSFAIIPDVIGGSSEENDALIAEWPHGKFIGAPVWPVADSEPVAWTWRYREQWHVTNDKCRAEFVATDGDVAVLPLYRHAQPAPVVQEVDADDNFYSWFGREWRENYQHNQYTTAAKQMLGVIAESAWKAGCRAAMLAAAPQSPGSEPATVPGKWIPVSERMPIEFEAVIAFDGDQVYGEAMHSSDDGFTIDGYDPCDRVQLQNVTHWMPLPSAPQEVKGE